MTSGVLEISEYHHEVAEGLEVARGARGPASGRGRHSIPSVNSQPSPTSISPSSILRSMSKIPMSTHAFPLNWLANRTFNDSSSPPSNLFGFFVGNNSSSRRGRRPSFRWVGSGPVPRVRCHRAQRLDVLVCRVWTRTVNTPGSDSMTTNEEGAVALEIGSVRGEARTGEVGRLGGGCVQESRKAELIAACQVM